MKISRNNILFFLSAIFAIWFVLTGTLWIYWAALYIAYPAGLISLVLWRIIANENRARTKFIPITLFVGLFLSLTVLIYLLIWE